MGFKCFDHSFLGNIAFLKKVLGVSSCILSL
jgi:hypothetical protein